ncbi:SURF1 family protein [Cellulomonas sp. URHE0023]|uniref:SURF1 family cytochrome oxidase biogenesis protein n=1 Tax=Cellulomonas sp. URHE0023 TaxID=1380354 RepID=UPI0005504945|nr:SURF1 family protein [Cellulomonas sp. URHE0023]
MSPAVRRATGLVVVALVLAVACSFLGRWQWNRHVWRDNAIAVVKANEQAEPVPLDEILPTTGAPLSPDDVWRRVEAVGHYEPDATVLLRNRPAGGTAAYHVLVPFVVEDASAGTAAEPTLQGSVLVVDRGWVATGETSAAAVDPPPPPAGTITVTVKLRQGERASGRSAPAGQVQAIAVDQVLDAADLAGAPTFEAYGGLTAESPAAAASLGPLPAPSKDPGSHLSYAFQWWLFALGGLVAFVYMARRELLESQDEGQPQDARLVDDEPRGASSPSQGDGPALWPTRDDPRPPRRRPVPRRSPADPNIPHRRGGRDEDAEDALIDAQIAASQQHPSH